MESIDIDKIIKLSIVASVLLIGFSLFYYLVIFLPQKEQNRIDLQKQERLIEEDEKQAKIEQQRNKEIEEQKEKVWNKLKLDACLAEADKDYTNFWESECEALGLGENCLLPTYNADRADKIKRQKRDECYKKYPQE